MTTAVTPGPGSVSVASHTVEDLLRLAWLAGGDGKPGMRDALMTLAVAESGPDDAVMAERCRRLLVARQPGHWFASTSTLGQALAHPKVSTALTKLRAMFPPVRVERILQRAEVERGPFTGTASDLPMARVLEDLGLTVRRDPAEKVPPAPHRSRPPLPYALPPVSPTADADAPETVVSFYTATLFALALLTYQALHPSPAHPRAD